MGISVLKLLILLAVVLIIFGSGKLPNALKDLGKGLRSLRDELKSDKNEDKSQDPKTIVINPPKDDNL